MLLRRGRCVDPAVWGNRERAKSPVWGVANAPDRGYFRSMTRTLPGAESAFAAIEQVAEAGLPSQELLEEVAPRIDRVIPSDGFFIGATDPHTSLAFGAGVVRDLPHDMCA